MMIITGIQKSERNPIWMPFSVNNPHLENLSGVDYINF